MKLKKLFQHPLMIYLYLTARGLTKIVPDELHLRFMYRVVLGRKLRLEHPNTFNEKLQWLKLNDKNPLYTALVDKILVKEWVKESIGEEFVTPTIEIWDDVDDIDLKKLPNQFVLKTNHDCGGLAICHDKDSFNFDVAKRKIKKHLNRNYYWGCREWPYKDVVPKIFAEEYLESDSNLGMLDYKFYCFNGEPKFLYVSEGLDNHETARISFLTMDWKFANFKRADYVGFENLPNKPQSFSEMIELSKKLSSGIPFVRVDFFEHNSKPRFSEMTFHPCGGFMPFDPPEWDQKLGSMLDLGQIK